MQLYPNVRRGQFINEYANFETFGVSFITLIRMMTGESWNGIMHECALFPPFCTPGLDCGGRTAYPFFISFQVVTSFLISNLVVAVVINQYVLTLVKIHSGVLHCLMLALVC